MTHFNIYNHDVMLTDTQISVDGKSYRLKTYTPYTYRVQKTQVQCYTAESLAVFIQDSFWEVTVKRMLKNLSGLI